MQKSKKILLPLDISGNVNQDELWAILESVNSDDEDALNNLLGDSDTEFELITNDAAIIVHKDVNGNKTDLVTKNCISGNP